MIVVVARVSSVGSRGRIDGFLVFVVMRKLVVFGF